VICAFVWRVVTPLRPCSRLAYCEGGSAWFVACRLFSYVLQRSPFSCLPSCSRRVMSGFAALLVVVPSPVLPPVFAAPASIAFLFPFAGEKWKRVALGVFSSVLLARRLVSARSRTRAAVSLGRDRRRCLRVFFVLGVFSCFGGVGGGGWFLFFVVNLGCFFFFVGAVGQPLLPFCCGAAPDPFFPVCLASMLTGPIFRVVRGCLFLSHFFSCSLRDSERKSLVRMAGARCMVFR